MFKITFAQIYKRKQQIGLKISHNKWTEVYGRWQEFKESLNHLT